MATVYGLQQRQNERLRRCRIQFYVQINGAIKTDGKKYHHQQKHQQQIEIQKKNGIIVDVETDAYIN